jgi:hypothetical protein
MRLLEIGLRERRPGGRAHARAEVAGVTREHARAPGPIARAPASPVGGAAASGDGPARLFSGGAGRAASEHALALRPCNIRGCGARTSHLTFPKS